MFIRLIFFTLVVSSGAFCQEIYKYKDESGRWVFTDRRPANKHDNEIDIVKYKERAKKPVPEVFMESRGSKTFLVANNPYHAPVEFFIKSAQLAGGSKKYVVAAASKQVLHKVSAKINSLRFSWRL